MGSQITDMQDLLSSAKLRAEQVPQSGEQFSKETMTSMGSNEDEVPSGYMVPKFQQKDLNEDKTSHAPSNITET